MLPGQAIVAVTTVSSHDSVLQAKKAAGACSNSKKTAAMTDAGIVTSVTADIEQSLTNERCLACQANAISLVQFHSVQAKQAAAAKEKQAAKPNTPALAEDEGEQLDPNQYFEMRVKALNAIKSSGKNPYPHKFAVRCSIPAFLSKWHGLASGEQRLEEADMESVAGVSAPEDAGIACEGVFITASLLLMSNLM